MINFTYDGIPLSGTAVGELPAGWTGREYERRYTQGRVDSGRIFTSRGPDETKSMRWDQLAIEQARIPNSLLGNVTVNDPNNATFTVVVDATPAFVAPATNSTTQTRIHQSDLGQVTGYTATAAGIAPLAFFRAFARKPLLNLLLVVLTFILLLFLEKLGYLGCNNACTLTVDNKQLYSGNFCYGGH